MELFMMESAPMGPSLMEWGNYAWKMDSFIKACFGRISFMVLEDLHTVMGATMKENGQMISEMAQENK